MSATKKSQSPQQKPKSAPATLVLQELAKRYPDVKAHLLHSSPWELLIATMLSAQCTDERVNKVTPELFKHWSSPATMAEAPLNALEECIHSVGFFHNKAKNIKACSAILVRDFNAQVPNTLEMLVKLPGVGRKTANVVLWGAYGLNFGLAVDTHVARISLRLGLTSGKEPDKAEKELMAVLPKTEWGNYNHRMVSFGREVCKARQPLCGSCPMSEFCPKIGVEHLV